MDQLYPLVNCGKTMSSSSDFTAYVGEGSVQRSVSSTANGQSLLDCMTAQFQSIRSMIVALVESTHSQLAKGWKAGKYLNADKIGKLHFAGKGLLPHLITNDDKDDKD